MRRPFPFGHPRAPMAAPAPSGGVRDPAGGSARARAPKQEHQSLPILVTLPKPGNPPVRASPSPVTTGLVLRHYSAKTLVFLACTGCHVSAAVRAGRQPLRPPIFAMSET